MRCGGGRLRAGRLRVAMVEPKPRFGRTLAWPGVGAAAGAIDRGETEPASMRAQRRGPAGPYAEALRRGRAGVAPG